MNQRIKLDNKENSQIHQHPDREVKIIKKSPYGIIEFVMTKSKDHGKLSKVKNARIVKPEEAKRRELHFTGI